MSTCVYVLLPCLFLKATSCRTSRRNEVKGWVFTWRTKSKRACGTNIRTHMDFPSYTPCSLYACMYRIYIAARYSYAMVIYYACCATTVTAAASAVVVVAVVTSAALPSSFVLHYSVVYRIYAKLTRVSSSPSTLPSDLCGVANPRIHASNPSLVRILLSDFFMRAGFRWFWHVGMLGLVLLLMKIWFCAVNCGAFKICDKRKFWKMSILGTNGTLRQTLYLSNNISAVTSFWILNFDSFISSFCKVAVGLRLLILISLHSLSWNGLLR